MAVVTGAKRPLTAGFTDASLMTGDVGTFPRAACQQDIFPGVKGRGARLCLTLRPREPHSPWNSPGQNAGVGSSSLLQVTFPTQGSTPGLPHCRRILHQLSHQGSPLWGYGTFTFGCAEANS